MTRRWAYPAAVALLLPGGFVLVACGWFYKRIAPRAAASTPPPNS